MKIVTREEMQWMDRTAIRERGIPSLSLMENAGRGVAQLIEREFRGAGGFVSVLCGRGNNGGDGFVVARTLLEAGCPVKTYLCAPEEEYRGDAQVNLHRLPERPIPLYHRRFLGERRNEISQSALIVDALFGTGLTRPVEGFLAELIRWVNGLRRPLVAVDIPSGLSADTGQVLGEAITAGLTATLHLPKRGLLFGPDAARAGEIRVIPIGIPADLEKKIRRREYLIAPSLFSELKIPRKRGSHKGSYGHVLTVAGSRRKIGAALMAARAALRVGAGLSTLALPSSAYQKISPRFSELMFEPQEDDGEFFSERSALSLLKLQKGKSVLALGPGMGTSPGLRHFVRKLLQGTKLPCVVDADGLNNLAGDKTLFKKKHPPWILTPHPGEMGRLLGKDTEWVLKNRERMVPDFSRRQGVTLLLKGYRSLVGTPEGSLFVNPTGNPGMATGGMGDVLTGVIAGLIAQGFAPERAVLAGVWIHGRAGDLVARRKGERGLTAWDLAEELPFVLKELAEGESTP